MAFRSRNILFLVFVLTLSGALLRVIWQQNVQSARSAKGVQEYNPELAYNGLNLYCSHDWPEAYLINMEGDVLHRWKGFSEQGGGWHNVKLTSDGALFSIETNVKLEKRDWNSKLIWRAAGTFHHDLDWDESGRIFTLERGEETVTFQNEPLRILNDYVTVLSPNGEREERISVYEMAKSLVPEQNLLRAKRFVGKRNPLTLNNDTPAEIFHTNSLQLLHQDYPGLGSKGDLLLSLREIDMIAVVSLAERKVVWSWGAEVLDKQHDPRVLGNGNILVFDNGRARKFSQVLEVEPRSKQIVWRYSPEDQKDFYSHRRGGSQRMPNGNTLITSGERGAVYEVTASGEVVWKFTNPNRKQVKNKLKYQTIYKMSRVTDPENFGLDRLLNLDSPG